MSTKHKTFDPSAWLSISDETEKKQSAPQGDHSVSQDTILDEIEIVTQRIEAAGTDITSNYAKWRDLGFALSSECGEAGRSYFHRISRFYPGYNESEADIQYDKCMRAHGTGVTIRTFFQLAKDAGVSVSIFSQFSKSAEFSKINNEKSEQNENSENEPEEERLPTFSDKIKGKLPQILQQVTDVEDNAQDGDILLLGALTAFSACLPNIYGYYARRKVFTNLFTFVTARASSGKGRLTLCRNLIDPIHDELRQLNEAEMEEYKSKMNEYNANKNKKSLEKPEQPPLRILLIPANSSATAVYQTLNENDGRGIIFETEGDTLANTFESDYGNYSDGFRKAFHHETISYIRRKDKEYVNIKAPQLSTLLTGTPLQVQSLIKDAENGLFSRFIFYYLSGNLEWRDVFAGDADLELDRHFQDIGQHFFDLYKLLTPSTGIQVRLTPRQQNEFNDYFGENQSRQYGKFGEHIIASVRRLGLITFRICMILTALRILEDGDTSSPLVCLDDDFHSAMTIVKVLMVHTDKVFTTLPAAGSTVKPKAKKNSVRTDKFWDALQDEFDRQDFIQAAAAVGIPRASADRYISKWMDEGILERLEQGRYRKT